MQSKRALPSSMLHREAVLYDDRDKGNARLGLHAVSGWWMIGVSAAHTHPPSFPLPHTHTHARTHMDLQMF